MGEKEIDAQLIQRGDMLKVHPGSKVPADGTIRWGYSHVDESMITGESTPVSKEIGGTVIGGTMNLNGALHIQATRIGSDTVLSQIVHLVETAQMTKAPIQKFADYVMPSQHNYSNSSNFFLLCSVRETLISHL